MSTESCAKFHHYTRYTWHLYTGLLHNIDIHYIIQEGDHYCEGISAVDINWSEITLYLSIIDQGK